MRDPRFNDTPAWARKLEPTTDELNDARTLARQVASGPAGYEQMTQALGTRPSRSPVWSYGFQAELVAAIREDTRRHRAWSDVLEAEVSPWTRTFPSFELPEHETQLIQAAAEDWRQETDPFCAWIHSSSHLEPWDVISKLNLLVRVDAQRGLRLCEALPFPSMMASVFWWGYDVRQDRDLIEALLIEAPGALDEKGAWRVERSVSALLITDLIVDHAEKLQRAVQSEVWGLQAPAAGPNAPLRDAQQALQELETTELPAWMRRAFGLLLTRADGRPIALGYLAHLVERTFGAPASPPGRRVWPVFEHALNALCEVLIVAGVGTSNVREAWERAEVIAREKEQRTATTRMVRRVQEKTRGDREGEGARTLSSQGMNYLWGAALMLGNDPREEDAIARLWAWFEELLEGRDPGLRLVEREQTAIEAAQRLGFLLARTVEPARVFTTTYHRLEPLRRRTQHPSRYGFEMHDRESTFLVRVGLHGTVNWHDRIKHNPSAGAARDLFFQVYAMARRLWLTSPNRYDEAKRNLVPLCFAFVPNLFGEQLAAALAKIIPPIANHARLLTEACWFLWKNGVESSALVSLVRAAGGDLEEALRDVKQWSDFVMLKQKEIAFPQTLRELAQAIGLTFPEGEAVPESQRVAQRRKDFLRGIPWGAALLRRLEDDDLSATDFTPFDAGNTWLLQTHVPSTLRDRFGLAPQLRILAVHGQVRGSDLRTGLQDPRDASEVDPDLIIIASDWPLLQEKVRHLAGPWGQRIPWMPTTVAFTPLADALDAHLPRFDLWSRRDPVRGRALIGRREPIDDIAARLLRGQAVAVLGLRKVGKSSLLQAVAEKIDPIGAQRGMFGLLEKPTPNLEVEALVVSLDVQGLIERTLQGLAERLGDELEERLELAGVRKRTPAGSVARTGQIVVEESLGATSTESDTIIEDSPDGSTKSSQPDDSFERLEQLLRAALDDQPRSIAIVLDEYDLLFEGYGGEPGIPGVYRLFALLRSLSQVTGRVSLAFIGRDPAFIHQAHLGGFTSPLLGWVELVGLGPLSRDDADELLARLGKRTCLDIGATTCNTAWRWTGGHPLLLREYGSSLFQLAKADYARPVATDPLCEAAAEVFWRRDAVQTICGEVRMLLEVRFPEALALVQEIASLPAEQTRAAIDKHGGPGGKAVETLAGFGLVIDPAGSAWVAEVWRGNFRRDRLGINRSGTTGE